MTMERPLASWRLGVPLRGYQADLLARVSPDDGTTLHLVAPPGAGKTMLGLALAARNGRRTLVLTPTTVIRAQWTEQASRFLRTSDGGAPAVADRIPGAGEEPADLTVLTYQALSVVDSTTPWEAAARSRWLDDLVSDGRTPARADAWLSALAADNPAAYARGLRSRAATVRARIDELDDDAVAALLAPGARERLDALIDAGTATIVLDECHHLRAHWAVVVHYLRRRLAAAGTAPTLIGLTATEPSSEDRSWRRYRALLGDADAEVPVPAVVRSGHLAPYRPLAWFTLPTPEETSFLTTAGAELRHRIAQYLLAPDGIDYLLGLVAPGLGADALAPASDAGAGGGPRPSRPLTPDDPLLVRALAAGFDDDPGLAAAAGALLRRTHDYTPTPLSVLVVPLLPEVDALDAAEELRLLARYALDRLLTDPARRDEWDDMRQSLRGFGLHVTDSGIRTGRSPLDVITAASRAKDAAVVDVLRHELEALGERLRAVVVTDAAERSAPHRALDVLVGVDGAGSTDAAGGAVRCFNAILADTALRGLHPILLTSSHLRLAHGDDELLEHLRACTGLELPAHDDGWSLSATGGGVGSADLVLAVSGLVASGAVRLVVGTRGLLGEGWDCPAVNTLVDLTTVTTSTAVQQLRGRTLRLDPAWPGKVAHNWSVACLVPAGSGLRSTTDLDRLRRKADRLWAVVLPDPDASGDSDPGPGAPVIETGLAGVLLPAQRRALDRVEAGATHEDIAALNTATVTTLGDRQAEGSRWSVGASGGASPMAASAASTSSTLHGAGRALEVVRIRARGGLLRHGTPTAFWTGAARAVLAAMGEHDDAVGSEASGLSGLLVLTDNERAGIGGEHIADTVVLGLDGVSGALSTRFADALAELLAPPRRRPRFVLEAAPLTLARPGRPDLGPVRRMLGRVASLGVWGAGRSLHLPVPTSLAASRVAMTAFAQAWSRYVGPCRVRLVRDADDAAALLASRGGGGRRRVTVRRARRWIEASEPRTTR